MSKLYSLVAIIAFLSLFGLWFLLKQNTPVDAPETEVPSSSQTSSPEELEKALAGNEEAVKDALNLFISKQKAGTDMTKGPCLGIVAKEWAVDVVHDPRTKDDDEAKNQCPDYVAGKVKHFIEFSPEGKLLRAK